MERLERIQQNATVITAPPPLTKRVGNSGNDEISHPASPNALKRLNNYRLGVGWLLLGFWFASLLALDWDVQWHVNVGRDGFWTPPHWMFYSTATAAGVICAALVLMETFLYYRRYPGFNKQTTTPVLFVFHGPQGFILAGFGLLTMVGSAPLDDYWHRILGIDVKVWTPFHMMLIIGMVITNIGLIYLFASELNRHRRLHPRPKLTGMNRLAQIRQYLGELLHPAMLGLMLAAAAFITRYLGLLSETLIGTLTLGSLKLPAYSLVLASLPLILVTLAGFSGRFGIATLAGLTFSLFRLVDIFFVNWGITNVAVNQGVSLRAGVNDVTAIEVLYPVFLPLAGLIVDLIYLASYQWREKARTIWPALAVAVGAALASGLMLYLLEKPWDVVNASLTRLAAVFNNAAFAVLAATNQFRPDYWQALPLVIIISVLAGVASVGVVASLRYSER